MASTLSNGVTAAVAGGGTLDIQPAVGAAYCIKEIVSDQAQVGGVPDVSYAFRDGALADADIVIDPTTEVMKGNRAKRIYISNTVYLRVTNTAAGAAVIGWLGEQVRADNVRTRIVTAPNGGTVNVQPPAGEVWEVTEIGAETANATNEPDLIITLATALVAGSVLATGARDPVWDSGLGWILTNTVFLTLAPIGAADNDIGLSIIRVDKEGFCAAAAIGAAATVAIQPPEGVEAVVTGVGGSVLAGVAPAGGPDLTLQMTDGVTPATIANAGSVADSLIKNRAFELEIDNTIYLQVVDTGGAGMNFAYCGYIRRRTMLT
jgi:hypothetical protein